MHGSTDSQDRRLLLKHVTYFNGDLVDAIIIPERPKGTLLVRLLELFAFALDLFFELFLIAICCLSFFSIARTRAASLGLKSRASIARKTRVEVLGATLAAPVITRDTVAVETQASLATSRIPILCTGCQQAC
jgi:hypothetical protein